MKTKNLIIQYHKWDLEVLKTLCNSILENTFIRQIQAYMPIMSLYFYYHNTPKSHKIIDFKRRYYLRNILNVHNNKNQYYNSNKILDGQVYDSIDNCIHNREMFLKILPILDPITYIMNNYNTHPRRNQYLPSNYTYNTSQKINSMENSSYIDSYMSFIGNYLKENNKLPCFANYYGGFNGIIDEFSYDITDEFHSFKNEKWFNTTIGRIFSVDVYHSDSESEDDIRDNEEDADKDAIDNIVTETVNDIIDDIISDKEVKDVVIGSMDKYIKVDDMVNECKDDDNESSISHSSNDTYSSYSSDNSSDNSSYFSNKDYIVNIKKFPVQMIFMEKLEETLEELLDDGYDEKLIKSIMFQIIFSLAYLQKHFEFTHNDLHINNVMYVNTNKKFLYYKYNNQYFKVPTYGKIAKIIDFGRAIFTIKNKVFFNDVFSKYGEAEGQYTHPTPSIHFNIEKKKNKKKHNPNYSFDLCRLATTMIEYIDENHKDLYRLLNRMATDCHGENLNDCDDSFDLYIKIAHDANKAIPKDLIDNKYFKEFRVKKKDIFKNSVIYNMN